MSSSIKHSFYYYKKILQTLLVFIFSLWMDSGLHAQGQKENRDSLNKEHRDSVNIADKGIILSGDSLSLGNLDGVPNGDSSKPKEATVEAKEQELGIKIAKDALPSVVNTTAKDSAVLNVKDKVFYLYGDAKANYEDLEIKSGVLVFYQKTNMLWAIPILDTAGKKISVQEFKQGDQTFTYDTLRYNFQSKRAIVRNAHSKYGDGFVISQQVKRNPDGSIFGYKSVYTTCDLDHPHFGIQAKRIKVIPNRVIASGPANLEVMDIPTPLFFPFGMFPIKQGQHSGFILPTYNLDNNRGIGLQNLGYYFAMGDHVGWATYMDFFSKGSWATRNNVQYANKYHYSGNFQINYSYTTAGSTGYGETAPVGGTKDFNVVWSHTVDPKATPNTTFGASVNFGTQSYNKINQIDYLSKVQNSYASSISYGKTWQGKPYSLSIAARHSQNTNSGALSITLPTINFNLGQFSPFQRKVMIGTPRWYEKITVSYAVTGENQYNTYDSLFSLKKLGLNDMSNAINHTANISATYNVLRFFNWNISLPYNEYWNTKQYFLYPHTDGSGRVDSVVKTGFFATRSTSLSTGLSTRIYGMKMFKNGKIAGIRHVMSPRIGLSYTPGYAHAPFNYLYQAKDIAGRPGYYSPYQFSPLSGPPVTPEPAGSVTFGLDNNLQIKVRNKDSSGNASTKNISLIDNFTINGFYNMFADSCNLSNINMAFSTNILNKINISASGVFTPYVYVGARQTRQYLLSAGRGLAQINSANVNFSMNFAGDKKNEKEQEDAKKNNDEVNRLLSNGGYNNYYDFNIPWNLSISGGLNFGRFYNAAAGATDNYVKWTPNMIIRGGFNLTERWKVNADVPLSFPDGFKKVSIPGANLAISRDLHCWQMSLNLVPFGTYRSFSFLLQVKSSVLQDLKLTRKTTIAPTSY